MYGVPPTWSRTGLYLVVGVGLGLLGVPFVFILAACVGMMVLEVLAWRLQQKAHRRTALRPAVSSASALQGEQIRELVPADLRMAFGPERLEEELPKWLNPSETVLALAACTHRGSWRQETRVKKNGRVIVATDRGLTLVPVSAILGKGLPADAHSQPESFPYSEIEGIEETNGRFESKLDIAMGTRTVGLTSMLAKGASSVASVVRPRAGLGEPENGSAR